MFIKEHQLEKYSIVRNWIKYGTQNIEKFNILNYVKSICTELFGSNLQTLFYRKVVLKNLGNLQRKYSMSFF